MSRTPDELLSSALCVLDKAFAVNPRVRHRGTMLPLLSGGYDSLCACYVASQHRKFRGEVHHIDTGIGSKATRKYVEEVCDEFDWQLMVYKSPSTYEDFVRERGFPGPAMHQWAYIRLKERCVRAMVKSRLSVLVTGCRSVESTRRMGYVEPVKVGEWEERTDKATGVKSRVLVNRNRIWCAPCHDWTDEEQREFVAAMHFPRNPVKDSILGMSGECFCGAFARPEEYEMIRRVCPDVADEIDRLSKIAEECGKPSKWGCRPEKKGLEVVETGPLCNSCDRKARAAGVVFKSVDTCGMIPETEVTDGEGQGQAEA